MNTVKERKPEVSGIIVRYTTNRHDDFDGFVLDQQGHTVEVRFPPHTARFIREIAAEGDTVGLVLREKPHPAHHEHPAGEKPKEPRPVLHLVAIENLTIREKFDVESVKPPHAPEAGDMIEFTIHQPKFTRAGKEAAITGVIHEGKFIHLHPDESKEDKDALAKARVLHIKAKRRTGTSGFVNAHGYKVYHAHSVKVDHRQAVE